MKWDDFDRGVFIVNVLGIVHDKETGKILIGKRENDPHIKELSWSFPGGRPDYDEDLEHYLAHEIKKKTDIDIDVKSVIFAKTYPEHRKFLSIYYYCEAKHTKHKSGEKFVETKWVKPTEVTKYFTTSLHPTVLSFLEGLE